MFEHADAQSSAQTSGPGPVTAVNTACDLCGLPLPHKPHQAAANGETYRFCCTGCKQVFLLLSESGLLGSDYKSSELYQTSLRLGIIGRPDQETAGARPSSIDLAGASELVLRVEGMWCSSCAWLLEKTVGAQPGVVSAQIIYASDTAKIHYRPEQIAPERITGTFAKLGYPAARRDVIDEGDRGRERTALLIRMGVALFLMNNIMFFSYTMYVGYFQELPPEMRSLVPYILLGLTLPSVTWCGWPIHRKAFGSLGRGTPTMEVLFSIGIISSFVYSVITLITGGEHYYFDTAAALVGLLLVGKFIELNAKQKASEDVTRLYRMLPRKVRILAPEGERLVGIEKLSPGDTFIVKAGEKIPADGEVVSGHAAVDESLLTGESKPVEKKSGGRVIASSMVINGTLSIKALRIGKETILSTIIEMVERALSTKSPVEQTVDRITRVFIPAVMVLAAGTAAVMLTLGYDTDVAFLRAMSVLLIACPCALGMATPVAIAAGIGLAAKRGILIADSAALQRAATVTDIVFDKTGTLTEGKFVLSECVVPEGSADEALCLVGSLEQSSSHPIAGAIVAACREKSLALAEQYTVALTDGTGVDGCVDGRRVVAGNEQFVARAGFVPDERIRSGAEAEVRLGRTVVFIGVEGWTGTGYCVLGDTLKSGARESVERLRALGMEVHLVSGDATHTTGAIAAQAGIASVRAQQLPHQKLDYLRSLQASGRTVAMAGDGVNDAPSLAQADAGMAMGSGTELAIASSSFTLLRAEPVLVPEAVLISRKTLRVVKQNLLWSFLYNTIGIVLAMAGILNPLIAAGAMLASSLSIVGNSIRLGKSKIL